MDIWFTFGNLVGYAIVIVIAGLIVWAVYGILKKIKNKISKKN
jgi:hypothetical protein